MRASARKLAAVEASCCRTGPDGHCRIYAKYPEVVEQNKADFTYIPFLKPWILPICNAN